MKIVERWRLGSCVIAEDDEGQLWWITWLHGLHWQTILGLAWVDKHYDLLAMSGWKIALNSKQKSWDEVNRILNSYPQWDRTTYVEEGGDHVVNCKTLEDAPIEIRKHIAVMHNS